MTTRKRALAAAVSLATLAWALPLPAVETPQYDVPYVGAAASFLKPDDVRNADVIGGGYSLFGGWPLDSGNTAIEVRLTDQGMRRKIDKKENYQTSLFADYLYDFGSSSRGGGFLMGSKLFVLAGLGLVREDSYGDPGYYLAVAGGGGALVPLGFRGWAIRLDGRVQGEMNKDLCNSTNTAAGFCTDEKSFLVDYMFQAGLQIPLTMFLEKAKPVAPAEDCPIAVVDPDAPRKDCAADSDRDGVPDPADDCPGSAPGSDVDAKGCAK